MTCGMANKWRSQDSSPGGLGKARFLPCIFRERLRRLGSQVRAHISTLLPFEGHKKGNDSVYPRMLGRSWVSPIIYLAGSLT